MKPRVVLDTNVHVAALSHMQSELAARVASREAIRLAAREFQPVITAETTRELTRLLMRERYDGAVKRSLRRDYIRTQAEISDYIVLKPQPELPACQDADDVVFLAAAAQREAKYLVTLDYRHLGRLGRVGETLIVTPMQFLLLEGQGARMGLSPEVPTRVVVTDQPPLLALGHAGSSVFLANAQADLLPARKYPVESLRVVPLYNPDNSKLRPGEPESWLAVSDNPDLLALKRHSNVAVMSGEAYALVRKALYVPTPASDVRTSKPKLVSHQVRKFSAGLRRG